ncbi:MAG: hypothetical protein PW789_19180 [Edaphobacter sp.]|uniref:DUF4139 domain-containing protein n=1 Tax=Edaphobacter sp. TaxID=1934404 RepID=UPI0023863A8F|nr:hypothetical protein [Edaphobacter sp.]MDE1178703.1 hypothetical protein [Edaphobacter sp.]
MHRPSCSLPPLASLSPLAIVAFVLSPAFAQQPAVTPTALTIYNQDFAVARTTVPLSLIAGDNQVLTANVTSQLEPDSVVLRDPTGHNAFTIAEQNYDAGVVTQEWLLEKYEGKMLDFQVGPSVIDKEGTSETHVAPRVIQGRVIRAGNNPLIEVNGRMQFQLPGTPLFPASTDGLLLKPTLRWQITAPKAASFPAELAYITHGISWQATYNVVLPESSSTASSEMADVLGWVTIRNESGTDFPQATIQLMAGDVAKVQEFRPRAMMAGVAGMGSSVMADQIAVTQKDFDDFHLYDLHRTVALRNSETKQVQFLESSGVAVERTYVYTNGYQQPVYAGFFNVQPSYGLTNNKRVTIQQEIKNSEANHLGMPLPAGRLRLYRRDSGGQMQFIGENMVQHTPAEQPVKITSGNAFDLTGERRQTDFHTDTNAHTIDESFEIKLSNQKPQPVVIHAVEHLHRAQNWKITAKSADYIKRDSNTADFAVNVPAKGETTITYTVHYSW